MRTLHQILPIVLALCGAVVGGAELPGQSQGTGPQLVPFGESFPKSVGLPPQLVVNGHLLTGSSIGVSIRKGLAGANGFVAVGPFSATPPPWISGIPLYFQTIPQLLAVGLDAQGSAAVGPIGIPPGTALLGAELNAQAVLFNSSIPGGLQSSRGLRARIGAPVPGPRYPRTLLPAPAELDHPFGVDLNADGEGDLVAVAKGAGDAVVMITGTEGEPGQPILVNLLPASLGPGKDAVQSLTAGDVDGDGSLDLIASNGANELSWAAGDGNGGFSAPIVSTHPSTAGLTELVATDVTGNGRVELFVIDDPASNQPQLLRFDNPGSGTFILAQTTPLPGPATNLSVGDIDGDGLGDFAARHSIAGGNDELLLLMGSPGGVAPAIQIPLPGSGGHLTITDLDDDGYSDIVLDNSWFPLNELLLWHGGPQGISQMSPPIAVTLPTSYDIADLLAADLDDDDNPEILCSDSALIREVLVFQSGPGPRSYPSPSRIPQTRNAVQLAALRSQRMGGAALLLAQDSRILALLPTGQGTRVDARVRQVTNGSRIVHCGDLTGDDLPDVLLFVDAAGNTRRVELLPGNGDGTFQPAQTISAVPPSTRDVTVADLDGDGDLDIAAPVPGTNPSLALFLNQGGGVFLQTSSAQLGTSTIGGSTVVTTPNHIKAADLNGDGRPDLVIALSQPREIRALRNEGGLSFTELPPIPIQDGASVVQLADVDGDGAIDAVVGHTVLASMEVLGNAGQGLLNPPITAPLPFPPYDLAVFDLDVDGLPDVFATDTTGLFFPMQVLQGNGTLTPAPAVSLPTPAGSGQMLFTDLTGDQVAELVTGSLIAQGSRLHVQEVANPTIARFSPPQTLSLGDLSRITTSLAAADLNQDGLPDLITIAGTPFQPPSTDQVAMRVFLHQRGGRK